MKEKGLNTSSWNAIVGEVMIGTSIITTVENYVRRWTEDAPKQANPNGPVILARPEYFNQIMSNPNIGFVLVKALYGYGKTYGFGYGIYHEAKRVGTFDAVYINARGVRSRLESAGEPYSLKGESTDIIRMVCGGVQLGFANNSDGIYLTTNLSTLNTVCSNFKNYISIGDSVKALRQFYRDLAGHNDKRIFLVIDEFERSTGTSIEKPDPQVLYDWIYVTLNALRPGVLEDLPGRFTLVFLIQEIYYPSINMRRLLESGEHPTLGRMLSVNNDGSIPIRFSEESLLDYAERIIMELMNNKVIPLDNPNVVIGILRSTQVRKLIREYLVNTPASITFGILNEVIKYAVSSSDITTDSVVNVFRNLLDQYSIYEIYAGKRTVAKGEYLANAAAGLLEKYYSDVRSINIVSSKVLRVGFEGAYVTTPDNGELKAVVFRLSDVDNPQKYINEFKRLYGTVLKEYCAQQQSRRQMQTNCEVMLLFTHDVNAGPAYNALTRLNMIDGVRVAFNVRPVKLTYDDLFVLIAGNNEGRISMIAGHQRYINNRLIEVVNKVFTATST
jgi:hypothetical protein